MNPHLSPTRCTSRSNKEEKQRGHHILHTIPVRSAEAGAAEGSLSFSLSLFLSLSLSFSLSLSLSLLLPLSFSFFLFFSQGKRENLPVQKGKRERNKPNMFTPNSLDIHTARAHARATRNDFPVELTPNLRFLLLGFWSWYHHA